MFVHIPLGIAIVAPFITLGQTIAIWRKWIPAKVWLAVVMALAALFIACFIAQRSGDAEHDRVAQVVPHEAIEEHEEAAELFTVIVGVNLGLAVVAWLLRNRRLGGILRLATVLVAFLMLVQAVQTGHRGGLLVYKYGACRAYGEEKK